MLCSQCECASGLDEYRWVGVGWAGSARRRDAHDGEEASMRNLQKIRHVVHLPAFAMANAGSRFPIGLHLKWPSSSGERFGVLVRDHSDDL